MKWFKKEKPLFDKGWKDIKMKVGIELAELEVEDPLERIKFQMAIIMDTDTAYIDRLPTAAIIEFTKEYEFIGKLPEKKLTKTFKWKGKRYGVVDFDKMSLAQFVDIEEYYNNGFLKNLHKILSVIYLPVKKWNPITKKYTLEEYEPDIEREDMFLELDMEFVWTTILFFYHIGQIYITNINSYLEQMNQKMKEKREAEESQ
jgi:hypothetical protein